MKKEKVKCSIVIPKTEYDKIMKFVEKRLEFRSKAHFISIAISEKVLECEAEEWADSKEGK